MRLRFAVSGQAPKSEAKEQPPETKEQGSETKAPESETIEPASATNDETKIKAATGN
jgi:two-component system nitrogen regulation sensor histidine kinase NtrY